MAHRSARRQARPGCTSGEAARGSQARHPARNAARIVPDGPGCTTREHRGRFAARFSRGLRRGGISHWVGGARAWEDFCSFWPPWGTHVFLKNAVFAPPSPRTRTCGRAVPNAAFAQVREKRGTNRARWPSSRHLQGSGAVGWISDSTPRSFLSAQDTFGGSCSTVSIMPGGDALRIGPKR